MSEGFEIPSAYDEGEDDDGDGYDMIEAVKKERALLDTILTERGIEAQITLEPVMMEHYVTLSAYDLVKLLGIEPDDVDLDV